MLPPFKGDVLYKMDYYSLTVKVFTQIHLTSITEVTSNYIMGKFRSILEGEERKRKKVRGSGNEKDYFLTRKS